MIRLFVGDIFNVLEVSVICLLLIHISRNEIRGCPGGLTCGNRVCRSRCFISSALSRRHGIEHLGGHPLVFHILLCAGLLHADLCVSAQSG